MHATHHTKDVVTYMHARRELPGLHVHPTALGPPGQGEGEVNGPEAVDVPCRQVAAHDEEGLPEVCVCRCV